MEPDKEYDEIRTYHLTVLDETGEILEFDTEAKAQAKADTLAAKGIPSNLGFSKTYIEKTAKKATAKKK